MARFLFCPAPELGDIFPTLPLALALAARGHDVAYVLAPDVADEVRAEGFTCYASPGGVYGSEDRDAWSRGWSTHAQMSAQIAVIARAYDAFRADVLVDGAFPFGPRLFAESRGVARGTIFSGCFPIPSNDALFPHGPGHLPPTDERGAALARLAVLLQEERERPETVAWNAARHSLGLAPTARHPARDIASPYLVIVASAPAFEYPRTDLPQHYWFVGPLSWESRSAEMPSRIAALSRDVPIVYVSQGATYNRNPVILKLAFAALEGEAVNVVATTVRPFDRSEFAPLPPNVVLERFVPFSRLVDDISLCVTHGGAGAVQTAISRGIPVLTLPFCADQFEVAARCEWSGAGRRHDPWSCTPEAFRDSVRALLTDPRYRENARRIAASNAGCGGAGLGASLLERLARTRQPVVRAPVAIA
jgi:UDP:flavonoid glycosyltransferase YjiC (YdhE family)